MVAAHDQLRLNLEIIAPQSTWEWLGPNVFLINSSIFLGLMVLWPLGVPGAICRKVSNFKCFYFRVAIYLFPLLVALAFSGIEDGPPLAGLVLVHVLMTAIRLGGGTAFSDWKALVLCGIGNKLFVIPYLWHKDDGGRQHALYALGLLVGLDMIRIGMYFYSGCDFKQFHANYFGYPGDHTSLFVPLYNRDKRVKDGE